MYLNKKDNCCYGCKKWRDCIDYLSCDDALDCDRCHGCYKYKNDENQKKIIEEDEFFD